MARLTCSPLHTAQPPGTHTRALPFIILTHAAPPLPPPTPCPLPPSHCALHPSRTGTTLYDVAGGLGMAAATALNALASRELGPAYDRVAVPPVLVTSGPYRWMQHPIYASYILLFFSYGMWLHSATAACALLLACGLYYRGRTALEGKVLEGAFGTYYRDYVARTKCWLIL